MRRTLSTLTLLFAGLFAAMTAQAGTPKVTVHPTARITAKVDVTQRVVRENSHPARIANLADGGRVSPSMPMNHLMLVLKGSDEQDYALASLLDQQMDKGHPNFHQWITPEAFGASFGVDPSDIAQVTGWLQGSGFTVNSVEKSGRIIIFSGNAGQVEKAFGTEMHQYTVNGEVRTANATDISIPKALADVVAGPAELSNFRPHANHVAARNVKIGKDGSFIEPLKAGASPDYTSLTSARHYVGAADIATIFDTNPLLNAGINGKGVTIGVIGQTDINLADVEIYRTFFNLPKNDPVFDYVGTDPGTIADDIESYLDVELSGAAAPGATIQFTVAGNSIYGAGINSVIEYLVNNNSADIMSLSYGECEYGDGAAGEAFYNVVFEEAAAQGQSAFISSDDAGPAGCDNDNTALYSRDGYAVNGLASTPYDVAVGGTMFAEGAATGVTPYWGPGGSIPFSSALGYIPEYPWNEGYFDYLGPTAGYGGIVSGGSGVSSYFVTPSWQTGPGVPTTDPVLPQTAYNKNAVGGSNHRYLPDVSLIAAGGHDGTIFCGEGSCILNSDGSAAGIGAVGGTSVAAPTMAGMQALINQKNGGRQGLPNYYYYRVAAAQSSTTCNSATYVNGAATATCGFHDIQSGNNNVPTNAADTTSIGFTAGPGYDLAVGLGSLDATNLANLWSSVTFRATTTTFSVTPTTATNGQATFNTTIQVSPVSGTGAPTGDIAIIAQTVVGGSVGFFTLTAANGGLVNGQITSLPAGTYKLYAHYAGDTTFGGSNSPAVTMTVGQTAPAIALQSDQLTTAGQYGPLSNFTYGTNVYLIGGISTTYPVPTGSATFTVTGNGKTYPSTSVVDPNGSVVGTTNYSAGTYADYGLGLTADDVAPTNFLLPVGTYTATLTYAGDADYSTITSAPITFVVGPAATTLTVHAPAEVAPGASFVANATVSTLAYTAGGVPATGTVTVTDSVSGATLFSGPISTYTVGSTPAGEVGFTTSLTALGSHTLTFVYSGDNNYATKTATATVVVGGTASTITVAPSVTTSQVLQSVTFTATDLTAATAASVSFYDNNNYLGAATLSLTTHTAAYTTTSLNAGTHNIVAVYAGSSTGTTPQDAATSAALPYVVTQNTPTVQFTSNLQNPTANAPIAMQGVMVFNPAPATTANPVPTNSIQFLDGTTVLGTAPVTYLPGGYYHYTGAFTLTAGLKPGVHTLGAKYLGDTNYAASPLSNTQTVNVGLTTTSITSSVSRVGTNFAFTLTSTTTPVQTTSTPVGGTTSFYAGTVLLGTAPVTNGVATLTTATLTAPGTYSITAVYNGDQNFYTSTSGSVTVTAITPSFSSSISPANLTIVRGQAGSATITVNTVGDFAGTFAFSCAGLPAYSYCNFAPTNAISSSVYSGSNDAATATFAMTVATTAPTPEYAGGLLWIPALFFAGFLLVRRKQLSGRTRNLIALAVVFCGVAALSGCGGNVPHNGIQNGTPLGAATITVTEVGTGATTASGTVTSTASFNINVIAQ